MNCVHCKQGLKYKKSTEIPKKDNWYYICCNNCGNVMKAHIVDDTIKEIKPTPTDNSEETLNEIYLAKKLFEDAGHPVSRYEFDKSSYDSPKTEETLLESTNDAKEEQAATNEVTVEQNPPIKKSLWAKIKDFCKKLF